MLREKGLTPRAAIGCLIFVVACGSSDGSTGLFDADGGAGSAGAGGAGAGGGTGGNGGSGAVGASGGSSGSGGKAGAAGAGGCASPSADDDVDGDGFTKADGDCDECKPEVNPGAYDIGGNGLDDDCNGTPDDPVVACDAAITSIADDDPMNAARAIGLCRVAENGSWGVVSAKYVQIDGSPGAAALSHGLLPDFGPNVAVREGKRLLALSTGTARRPNDAGYQAPSGADMGTTANAPPGFPIDSPSCTVQTANDKQAHDSIALELLLRTPSNVLSFEIDFDFYTYEFPQFVCSQFNDFFVALQSPAPIGALSGSIGFDQDKNPISVNSSLLSACTPQTAGGKPFQCLLGTAELMGTGFEDHAATGWLGVKSPVDPSSEVMLRIGVWDMVDHIQDTTVLVDHFRWSTEAVSEPVTLPAP